VYFYDAKIQTNIKQNLVKNTRGNHKKKLNIFLKVFGTGPDLAQPFWAGPDPAHILWAGLMFQPQKNEELVAGYCAEHSNQ